MLLISAALASKGEAIELEMVRLSTANGDNISTETLQDKIKDRVASEMYYQDTIGDPYVNSTCQ